MVFECLLPTIQSSRLNCPGFITISQILIHQKNTETLPPTLCLHMPTGAPAYPQSQNCYSLYTSLTSLPINNGFPSTVMWESSPVLRQPRYWLTPAGLPKKLLFPTCCYKHSHCTSLHHCRLCNHQSLLLISSLQSWPPWGRGESVLMHGSANGEEKEECPLTTRKGAHPTCLNN